MNDRRKTLFGLVVLVTLCFSRPARAQVADWAEQPVVPPAGIWGLEFSPDGQWLAAATNARGHGGPVVIWRVADWKPHVVRWEPTGGLHVAFSPDGKLLAYSTRSPQVGLIEVSSGKLARSIKALDTDEGTVFCVAFSPDGKSLLTSGTDGKIRQWNLADGSLRRTFEGHSDTVDGVAVAPDGSILLSGGHDHKSRLWDMRTGEVLQVFEPADSIVRRVRFSHDGRFFLTSRWDGKTRVRDASTRRLRAVLPTGSNSAALSRDNRLAATTNYGTTASVYRLQLDPPEPGQLQQIRRLIRQLDDDKLLATGCRGGDLKIWSVPDFKELVTLTAPPAE